MTCRQTSLVDVDVVTLMGGRDKAMEEPEAGWCLRRRVGWWLVRRRWRRSFGTDGRCLRGLSGEAVTWELVERLMATMTTRPGRVESVLT